MDEFIIKSTSGRIHYLSSQVDGFIIKSTKWMSSSRGDALKLSSSQVGEFIKSTSERGYYEAHRWMDLLSGPQIELVHCHA